MESLTAFRVPCLGDVVSVLQHLLVSHSLTLGGVQGGKCDEGSLMEQPQAPNGALKMCVRGSAMGRERARGKEGSGEGA